MSWSYDPKTRIAGDAQDAFIPRIRVEAAAERLIAIRPALSQRLIVDVLKSLTGLSSGEVLFNLNLVLGDRYAAKKTPL